MASASCISTECSPRASSCAASRKRALTACARMPPHDASSSAPAALRPCDARERVNGLLVSVMHPQPCLAASAQPSALPAPKLPSTH
eukprot:2466785-Prymnesium_polylepis.1